MLHNNIIWNILLIYYNDTNDRKKLIKYLTNNLKMPVFYVHVIYRYVSVIITGLF